MSHTPNVDTCMYFISILKQSIVYTSTVITYTLWVIYTLRWYVFAPCWRPHYDIEIKKLFLCFQVGFILLCMYWLCVCLLYYVVLSKVFFKRRSYTICLSRIFYAYYRRLAFFLTFLTITYEWSKFTIHHHQSDAKVEVKMFCCLFLFRKFYKLLRFV